MEVEGKPLSEFDIKPGDRFKLVGHMNWNDLHMGDTYSAQFNSELATGRIHLVNDTSRGFRELNSQALFIRLDEPKQYVTINDKSGHVTYHTTKDSLTEYAAGSNHKFRSFELGKELEFTKEVVWK